MFPGDGIFVKETELNSSTPILAAFTLGRGYFDFVLFDLRSRHQIDFILLNNSRRQAVKVCKNFYLQFDNKIQLVAFNYGSMPMAENKLPWGS